MITKEREETVAPHYENIRKTAKVIVRKKIVRHISDKIGTLVEKEESGDRDKNTILERLIAGL